MKKLEQILAILAIPCGWPGNRKRGTTAMFANAASAPSEGTHRESKGFFSAAAFNARRIAYGDGAAHDNTVAADRGPKLVKITSTTLSAGVGFGPNVGSADVTNYVGPCAAITDLPLGVVDDSPETAGIPITVQLLGHPPTKLVFAEEAITVGQRCCVGASGGVRLYGGSASGGASGAPAYYVGVCIGSPASSAGDVIELLDCAPVPVINA